MELLWIEDFLPDGILKKRMFGGHAYYLDEKLVLVLFESQGNKEYRGQKFDFEIWNGCMFPVEKENHGAVLKAFPFLIHHPVLPKWLYLPLESENFESNAELLLRELRRHNPLFGSIPKIKKPKTARRTSQKEEEIIDTRRPRMFSEDSAEEVLRKAQKISDLKNLGPESERAFAKAGIKSAPALIKMGWKKAMVQMCKAEPKNNHSIFAYAVIGALQNKMWNLISEEDKKEARDFMKALRGQKKSVGKKGSAGKRTKKVRKKKTAAKKAKKTKTVKKTMKTQQTGKRKSKSRS